MPSDSQPDTAVDPPADPSVQDSASAKTPTTRDRVAERVGGIQAESDALRRLATALAPFAKEETYAGFGTLAKAADRVAARLTEATDAPAEALARAEEVLEIVRQEVEDKKRAMREQLAPELRAACEARGLGMKVLRREEPVELRIPPLGVKIDREKGQAEIRFGRMPLVTAPAEAIAIVQAHEEALRALDTPNFDGADFFDACRRAWSAARAATGAGERVEILDFLPYLAMQMQPKAFQVDPSQRNYKGYTRVQFAWDVLRLRRGGSFSRDGWRFNLGVATGTTATQKKRVIWFEDEHGDGEFKLTVFFTRTENAG